MGSWLNPQLVLYNLTKQQIRKLEQMDAKMSQESAYRNQTWCQTCSYFQSLLNIFSMNRNKTKSLMIEYKKQEKFVKIYHRMLKVRKHILNKSSTACAPLSQAYLLYTCYTLFFFWSESSCQVLSHLITWMRIN